MVLPDFEDVEPATLIIRAGKGKLIMSISLAVIEGHQARFLKHVILSDGRDDLPVTGYALETSFSLHLLQFFVKLVLKILVCLNWIQLFASFLLCQPRRVRGSSLKGDAPLCPHFFRLCLYLFLIFCFKLFNFWFFLWVIFLFLFLFGIFLNYSFSIDWNILNGFGNFFTF